MISNPYAKKAPAAAEAPVNGNNAAPPHPATAAPPRRRANPYAAAAASSTAAAATSTATNGSARTAAAAAASAASSIPHIPPPRAATFSQAFDSFEFDTIAAVHDQQQQQQPSPSNNPQQQPVLSERDHHVLLQQPHVLYVSPKQRGNGVLDCIRNVPLQYTKMVPDFIFSSTACALFLSVRYHNLKPEYIYRRVAALQSDFALRVLLVLVDVDDNAGPLLELNKAAVSHNLTLILAWSEEEAARYLETYKALDGRDASSIQKAKDSTNNLADQVTDFLTACRGVNKTDAAQIGTEFGTVRAAARAAPDELGLIGGLGPVKVQRLHDAFHKPFSSKRARERRQKKERQQQQQQQQAEEAAEAAKLANRDAKGDDDDENEEEEEEEFEEVDLES